MTNIGNSPALRGGNPYISGAGYTSGVTSGGGSFGQGGAMSQLAGGFQSFVQGGSALMGNPSRGEEIGSTSTVNPNGGKIPPLGKAPAKTEEAPKTQTDDKRPASIFDDDEGGGGGGEE